MGYPKVMVIIPTYNQKRYLKIAIDSALRQDYPNLEILVGDDCSSDGTDLSMHQYSSQVNYIRHRKNLGPGYNQAHLLLHYANAKYAVILDHDDYFVQSNFVSSAVKLLESRPNLAFVWANCRYLYASTGRTRRKRAKLPQITPGADYFLKYQTKNYPTITGLLSSVFHVSKLRATNYVTENTALFDTTLFLNLMLMGDVGFIDQYVSVHYVHRESITYNFPPGFDSLVFKEFENLGQLALNKQLATEVYLKKWINRLVYRYVRWRYAEEIGVGRKHEADCLLASIAKYPLAHAKMLRRLGS